MEDSEAKMLTVENAAQVAEWCGGNPVLEHDALDHNKTYPAINVPTKDGVKRASLNDIVIQKQDGSFDVYYHI